MLRLFSFCFAALFILSSFSLPCHAAEENASVAQVSNSQTFAVPAGLEDEVRFWRTIFGAYGSDQLVFYDEKFLHVIYEVLDFRDLSARKDLSAEAKRSFRQNQIARTMRNIASSLRHLAACTEENSQDCFLTESEQYYQKLFARVAQQGRLPHKTPLPSDFQAASARVRVQMGQKERLKRAVLEAAPHMADIHAVFEKKGLPIELTNLVFIESMFNPKALSEVGALGLWQFMPETGREYVAINPFWDDRSDPYRSSEGAADFLAELFRRTGDWGTAINSYHSGLARLLRARKVLQTKDIAKIIHHYDDPAYGFYSRNYFPEFLAMVDIYKNRKDYFAIDENAEIAPLQYDIVKTEDFVKLPELVARFAIDMKLLKKLNPSLKEEVLSGKLPLPPYYHLKVPRGLGYYLASSIGFGAQANTQRK